MTQRTESGRIVGLYTPPQPLHTCDAPHTLHLGNTVWQCDCGKYFILTWQTQSGETWKHWEPATKQQAKSAERDAVVARRTVV